MPTRSFKTLVQEEIDANPEFGVMLAREVCKMETVGPELTSIIESFEKNKKNYLA